MELILFVLVGLLACCLVGSIWHLIAEPERARVLRRSYRPVVEWLSERLVPAKFYWLGVTTAWENMNNWQRDDDVNRYPGDGVNNDEVFFDNQAMLKNCELTSSVTVGRLELKSDFTKRLTVKQGFDLRVLAVRDDDKFSMSAGELYLTGNASLSLVGAATHVYQGGDLNSGAESGMGRIYVHTSSTLTFIQDGTKLGADLFVGKMLDGTNSTGYVYFATETKNLNAHVKLYNNANIINYKYGQITFYQNQNSDTKGGIDRTAGSTSRIENYGEMFRTTKDANPELFLKIVPPVDGRDKDSLLYVGEDCKIEFERNYTQWGGKVDQSAKGSKIKGLAKKAGVFRLVDPGAGGNYVASIVGDFAMEGGDIIFAITTPGVNATLEMTDSFLLSGGTATVPMNQHLTIDKNFTQTGGSVAVTGYGALFHVDGNYTQSDGTMTAQGTGGTVSVYGTFYISGDTFALDNGLVTAFNGVTVKPGGNLSVTNSATITGDLTNEGTITLAASALLEVSGDYTQTGTLNVSLGGPTAYGRLHVSGLATLGGTLNVTLYGGYMPSPMSQFTILTYGSRSGTFSGHNLPPLTIGVWQDPLLGYENDRFTLRTLYF